MEKQTPCPEKRRKTPSEPEESALVLHALLKHRFKADKKPAAEIICQGIILGLYRAEEFDSDGALGWAPDFPAEATVGNLTTLLELYPQRQRRAAGNRVIKAIEEHVDTWGEMMDRVIDETASKKRKQR